MTGINSRSRDINVSPSVAAVFVLGISFLLTIGPPVAQADGVLSGYESTLVERAHGSICDELDAGAATVTADAHYRTVSYLVDLISDGAGVSWGDAGDVVWAVSQQYCPAHLPYLRQVHDLLQDQ